LLILVLNARDAMPEGGELTVEAANVHLDEHYAATHVGSRTGPHVRLSVADSGSGMDEETRHRAFKTFFTTKPAGKGSGLGLAVVDGIVAQAGGHITLEFQPDRDTTLTVLLPATDAVAVPSVQDGPVPKIDLGRKTILLCEDETMVRESLSRLLQASGFTVLSAEGGTEALQKANSHPAPIDLLLTDVVLPGMSGPALAIALTEQHPDVRVLYMTGYGPEVLDSDSGLGDWADLILKPCRSDALLAKISELFRGG
jgi:CheY-like chemotaxis protein